MLPGFLPALGNSFGSIGDGESSQRVVNTSTGVVPTAQILTASTRSSLPTTRCLEQLSYVFTRKPLSFEKSKRVKNPSLSFADRFRDKIKDQQSQREMVITSRRL
jgi:hypothetical protein